VSATESCEDCGGTGRYVDVEELYDDDGDLIAEVEHDEGPCDCCDGRGSYPAETEEETAAREAQEEQARHARRDTIIQRHLATVNVHGYAYCPYGCPVAHELWREHVAPGGVHDTQCFDRCIGY
jgi:hypothetical protein